MKDEMVLKDIFLKKKIPRIVLLSLYIFYCMAKRSYIRKRMKTYAKDEAARKQRH
jgi:hypothetical protein